MSKPDLIFETKDNAEKIRRVLNKPLQASCRLCGSFVGGPHDCPGELLKGKTK